MICILLKVGTNCTMCTHTCENMNIYMEIYKHKTPIIRTIFLSSNKKAKMSSFFFCFQKFQLVQLVTLSPSCSKNAAMVSSYIYMYSSIVISILRHGKQSVYSQSLTFLKISGNCATLILLSLFCTFGTMDHSVILKYLSTQSISRLTPSSGL